MPYNILKVFYDVVHYPIDLVNVFEEFSENLFDPKINN